MKIVTGVDLVEIDRFREVVGRFGDRFINRIYTPLEIAEAGKNIASLAVRFAAKEAASKALGTGIGYIGWQEIEIRRSDSQQPLLFLLGNAAHRGYELGITHWSISLSHTTTHAIAMITGIGE